MTQSGRCGNKPRNPHSIRAIRVKKNAGDRYRRPVLTSETTKRKKFSKYLLIRNIVRPYLNFKQGFDQAGKVFKKEAGLPVMDSSLHFFCSDEHLHILPLGNEN
jgi:hypothetical protein